VLGPTCYVLTCYVPTCYVLTCDVRADVLRACWRAAGASSVTDYGPRATDHGSGVHVRK